MRMGGYFTLVMYYDTLINLFLSTGSGFSNVVISVVDVADCVVANGVTLGYGESATYECPSDSCSHRVITDDMQLKWAVKASSLQILGSSSPLSFAEVEIHGYEVYYSE